MCLAFFETRDVHIFLLRLICHVFVVRCLDRLRVSSLRTSGVALQS